MNFLIDALPHDSTTLGVIVTAGHPPHYVNDLDVRVNNHLFAWVRLAQKHEYPPKTTDWGVHLNNAHTGEYVHTQWFATKEEALQYALVLARLHSSTN